MRGATTRRRTKDAAAPNRHHQPPTPISTFNPWQHPFPSQTRDSDASHASSRPSHSSLPQTRPLDDKPALSTINSYISLTFPTLPQIKPPLSLHSIEIIKHLLSHLSLHISSNFENDLIPLLKLLNCPIKFNKSALRAPGERRASAMLIALIHWLVQLCQYNDGLMEKESSNDGMFSYVKDSYMFYMNGDDDAVVALDEDLIGKIQSQQGEFEEENLVMEREIGELEGRVEAGKGRPSRKEELEREKVELEGDVKKFDAIIEQYREHVGLMEKVVGEKERELEAKVVERKKICEENEEIKKVVEEQGINARDAERMKREIVAVERDINDAEVARNDWEEKTWNLNAEIRNKWKELEERAMECNQAIRRLKLASEFQYKLNAEGSTLSELLGIDYKTTLKPKLVASLENVKRASEERLDELIDLNQKAAQSASRIEAKRSRISTLATQIEEVEAQLDLIRNETQDYTSRCIAEARRIGEELEAETTNMTVAERDAADHLKVSEAKLQEAIVQTEEKVHSSYQKLFVVVDAVSKFKEHAALRISEMSADLAETAAKVADAHKYTLPVPSQHIDDKDMLMD